MAAGEIVLLGCGDVGPIHGPVGAYSTLAKPVLATADIRFAQVERVHSDRGALWLHSGGGYSLEDARQPVMACVSEDFDRRVTIEGDEVVVTSASGSRR